MFTRFVRKYIKCSQVKVRSLQFDRSRLFRNWEINPAFIFKFETNFLFIHRIPNRILMRNFLMSMTALFSTFAVSALLCIDNEALQQKYDEEVALNRVAVNFAQEASFQYYM